MSEPTKREPSRFDFIQRSESDPRVFHCEHELFSGQCVIAEYSFGTQIDFERIVGNEMGPFPTEKGQELATLHATLLCGFESIQGKKPDEAGVSWRSFGGKKGMDLLHALAEEVASYWRFRQDA